MAALMIVFLLSCAYAYGVQLNTTEGVVEGYKAADGDYYEFHGIPYAGPTNGTHRFKAPKPPKAYSGVFYANNINVTCAQPSYSGLIGVENCLVLNIFTKNLTASDPVIVWLNAEDYTNSSTHKFSPKRLVEQNVVFVSLNFRLSIFGFLCLGIQEAPGNAGLKDVIQGLKWLKSNIAEFGGDPNNIVLMGHASGAAMVDLITMAPHVDGLLHKAVALSGSAVASWAVAYEPAAYAEFLVANLEYIGKSKEDLVTHLVGLNTTVLNDALVKFLHFQNNTPLFAPCVENLKLNRSDIVIPDAPINQLRSGNYLHIPYITGYSTEEGTMRASEAVSANWLNAMNANFSDFIPVDLKLSMLSQSQTEDLAYYIKQFYFDFQPVNMLTLDKYLDYQGDILVAVPVIRGAKERSSTSKAEIRLMEFGYLGKNESDLLYNQTRINGVGHGAILKYLFDYDLKPSDEVVSKSIIQRFVGFVKSTGVQNDTNSSITWSPITKDHLNCLSFTNDQTSNFTEVLITNPHNRPYTFWKGLLDMHYTAPASVIYSFDIYNNNSNKLFRSIIFVILCQLLMRIF